MYDSKVVHHPDTNTFCLETEGHTAYVEYAIHDGELDILHTVVPPELSGRGIAALLVKHTYDYAREKGLTPAATCSYAKTWLLRECTR